MAVSSRFLSFILRHHPERLGLMLGAEGWVDVSALLAALAAHGQPTSREQLEALVLGNDKQRFALSHDGQRIRASQGHSLPIDLGLSPIEPPELLYHGTAQAFLSAIRREGLLKRGRHHVHLSGDVETATRVGLRRGPAVVLIVEAGAMSRAGHSFYRSDNGVWLTERVPSSFIQSQPAPGAAPGAPPPSR